MGPKVNKTTVSHFVQESRIGRWVVIVSLIGLFMVSASSALADGTVIDKDVEVAGIEISPGFDCNVGEATTCGVAFAGRPVKDKRGSVLFTIRYSGTAGFAEKVDIQGGFWRLVFKKQTYRGTVSAGGSVQWPNDGTGMVGPCPPGWAYVSAGLSGGASHFDGCLNDFKPDGSVIIPPKITGVMTP